MDKLIYLIAGLALGHILTRRAEEEEKSSESAFVPISAETLFQMQQSMQPPSMQPAPQQEEQGGIPPQKDCTFKCWLCSGMTKFHYSHNSGPIQFSVDCHCCGMENIIKLD